MSTDTKVKGYYYRLTFNGIYGRNRKVKLTSEKLLPFSQEKRDMSEVMEALDKALADLRPKSGSFRVTCDPVEREVCDGCVWEKFVLFSEEVVHQGKIGA